MKLTRTCRVNGIAALALLSFATPGLAQDYRGTLRQDPGNADRIVLGMGVIHAPAYQGSDEYRTIPVPSIDIVAGPFFANLRNGAGINFVQTSNLTVGTSVAIMPGYRRKDIPGRAKRLSVGAGGRLFASLKAGGAIASVGATRGFVGSTKGLIADATLSYPVPVSSRLTVIPSIGTTWANRRHNELYFGLTGKQAADAGLARSRRALDSRMSRS